MNRRQLISACALALGLAVTATGAGANSWNRLEYLTFSMPVALPGVTLAPGSYSFEISDPNNANLVLVRDRVTNNPKFLGFTHRIERPASMRRYDSRVVLGEARRGEAAPVLAWFPIDQERGYEFIYRTSGR